MAVAPWLLAGPSLVKFRYHVTFVNVVFGALIFARARDRELAWRLTALYLSFNVLLYGGLYTINDLADRDSDRRHPLKCQRPIASGRVSVRAASMWAAVLVSAGLASGVLLGGTTIAACYGSFIAVNLVYSFGGRNVVYADVLLNSLPHVLRFVMGALVVDRWPPATHMLAMLSIAVALSCLRRRIELDSMGWEARSSLRRWSPARLDGVMSTALIALAVLAYWKALSAPGFYAAVVGTATVLIGGAHLSDRIRRVLRWIWSH